MIKANPWTGGIDEEYETQHFGFGVQRLQIALRQMIEQKVTTGVHDMENYLQTALDLNETDKATLAHFANKIIKMYSDGAGPSLEIIDQEIERLFKIPINVLLPEDKVQNEQIPDEEYQCLKSEVTALRRQVERGALMEALLTAEEEEISSVEKICEIARKDMEELDLLSKNLNEKELVNIVNESEVLHASVPFMKKTDELNVLS